MSTLANELKFAPQKSGMTHAAWRAVSQWKMTQTAVWESSRRGTYSAGRNKKKAVMRKYKRVMRLEDQHMMSED